MPDDPEYPGEHELEHQSEPIDEDDSYEEMPEGEEATNKEASQDEYESEDLTEPPKRPELEQPTQFYPEPPERKPYRPSDQSDRNFDDEGYDGGGFREDYQDWKPK
jgi:hypothetical protein